MKLSTANGWIWMEKIIFNVLKGIKAGAMELIQFGAKKSSDDLNQHQESQTSLKEANTQFIPIDDNPEILSSKPRAIVTTIPEVRYFQIGDDFGVRKIAYTISGDLAGDNILICLPGLLETKASFSLIHAYFLKFENCQVISVDFPGRGESDYISGYGAYKMSLYLADISQFIHEIILGQRNEARKVTILGTSMGGVLAMYLTQIFGKKIFGVILNDIALTVNWTSLYTLYKSMKNELGFREIRELAKDLSVDERAISDVQLPGHFDLSYRADVWGMNFHEALEDFKGKVGLVYGAESKICTKQRVEEAKKFIPHMQALQVPNAGHPAPFNMLVCDFIQSQMGV
jgi:pimeloyl-ACP methyl ester carboxylesterase